jgi:ABC-type polysaccharide/polyol phosphate export permease
MIKRILSYFRDIWIHRSVIFQLVKRDVTESYKKSKMGMFWSLAEPILFVLVLNLVFGIGLRGGKNMDIPFICYLVSGLSVTNWFSQALVRGTLSVKRHSYLLKKMNFRLSLLPISDAITHMVDHLLFLVAVFVILLLNGEYPNWYWFQLIYYLIAHSILIFGLNFFTSSVGVIFPDLQHISSIISRVIFYFSPIIWTLESIPEDLHFYVKLNPLFYIVTGYRDSLFYNRPFWEQGYLNFYYWGLTFFLLALGAYVFSKLKPQFSDVV